MTTQNSYRTTELELASFLKARGYRLVSAKLDGRFVAFDFDPAASKDVGNYFGGTEVSARELFEAHRSLRALIQHEELPLRLDEATRVGYGFTLPTLTPAVVPKLHQNSAAEVAA